uniref:Putative ribosome biogenesis GTPase RsgA n=2 Tax=Lygus hesperus TaxID=30085 RepID=A0A0A9WXL1_LYGHE
MEQDLLVVKLKCSPFKLQRLYLPSSLAPQESGKHAVVELNDSSSFICRIFHDDLLQSDCCLLEKSVQCSSSSTASNERVKVSKINFIPFVKPIRSIKVTVVLNEIEQFTKWNDHNRLYPSLLKQLLQLFVINTRATVNLKDFQAAQKLGVYALHIKDIGIPHTGRVVSSTKVVIHEVTSWERYSLKLEKKDVRIAGNQQAYEQLKKYVSSRGLLRTNKLANDFDFSQLMLIGPGGSGKKTLVEKLLKNSTLF